VPPALIVVTVDTDEPVDVDTLADEVASALREV
jgi:hypothetical protein